MINRWSQAFTTPRVSEGAWRPETAYRPAADIFENEAELLLRADLPGVTRDAIELRLDGGALSFVATQPTRGRVFRRAFTLPETVDPSAVEAELSFGVLTVRLRKRADLRPRRVPIRGAD